VFHVYPYLPAKRPNSQYPRKMAGNHPTPPPPSDPPRHGSDAQPEASQPAERYGVVSVARHLKDDGRSLLLYTRTEHGSR
jgi:hypothetical protein